MAKTRIGPLKTRPRGAPRGRPFAPGNPYRVKPGQVLNPRGNADTLRVARALRAAIAGRRYDYLGDDAAAVDEMLALALRDAHVAQHVLQLALARRPEGPQRRRRPASQREDIDATIDDLAGL